MKSIILLLSVITILPAAFGGEPAFPPLHFLTGQEGSHDYWPCVSADGKSVIFSRRSANEPWRLYEVAIGGGEAAPFIEKKLPVAETRASCAANGKIAFTGGGPNQPGSLWSVDKNGNNARQLNIRDLTGTPAYPSWYPDGHDITFVAYQGSDGGVLTRLDLASGRIQPLTDPKKVLAGMPDVSPDGKHIVFAGQANEGQAYDQTKNKIWLLEEDGSTRALTATQGRAPKWSPDGKWIAYESTEGSPNGRYAIFLVSANGDAVRQISSYEWDANHPVWSPDGKSLVVSAVRPDHPKETHIALIDLLP